MLVGGARILVVTFVKNSGELSGTFWRRVTEGVTNAVWSSPGISMSPKCGKPSFVITRPQVRSSMAAIVASVSPLSFVVIPKRVVGETAKKGITMRKKLSVHREKHFFMSITIIALSEEHKNSLQNWLINTRFPMIFQNMLV